MTTEKAAELLEQLRSEVEELRSSEAWRSMLDTAARFHDYSFGNLMLIGRQCPEATRVAGFKTWLTLGRHVRKGEHGIRILAPMTFRKKVENGDENATEVGIRGFRVVSVFDVSQTDGDDLPESVEPELLTGQAPRGLWDALSAQVAAQGYTVGRAERASLAGFGPNGVTTWSSRSVLVASDLDDAAAAKTLAHELGHVLMHAGQPGDCKGRREVEAESVAYVVCTASGMPTSSYSVPYVAHYAGEDAKIIRATGEAVVKTARAILGAMESDEVAA